MSSPSRRRTAALVVAAFALFLVACPKSWRRPARGPFSALWVGADSPELEPAALARLRESGVRELFVDAGRLESGRVTPVAFPDVPSGTSATLVIGGAWPRPEEPETLGKALVESLRQAKFEAEGRGVLAAGFHFDLEGVGSLAALGEMLAAVRSGLDRDVFVSTTVDRERDADPELPQLAAAVDFLVPMLYGQRPGEAEATDAWDFGAVSERLGRYEELGKPYAVGIVTLGTATWRGRGASASTTSASLASVLTDQRLRLRAGFSLEGSNRRVYDLVAERAVPVGEWKLAAGDTLRVVRPAITDVKGLERRLDEAGLKHRLGDVYYRSCRPDERLSLGVDGIVAARDPAPSPVDLGLSAVIQRRAPGGWLLRFAAANRTGEATELSLVDNNFLEVHLRRGAFSSRVEPGDFYRFDLGHRDRDGRFVRDLRDSDTLLLFVPLLEDGQTVSSGDVLLSAPGGSLELELSASFILPDGRTAQVGPLPWKDGKLLVPEPPAPVPAPSPPAAGGG